MGLTVKVSFDFDGVLSRPVLQLFAAELLAADVDVWIVTMRFESMEAFLRHTRHLPDPDAAFQDNADLFAIADRLGIPRRKIVFTNWEWKSASLLEKDFVWHLDDCPDTLRHIQAHCRGVRAISAWNTTGWRRKCLKALGPLRISSYGSEP